MAKRDLLALPESPAEAARYQEVRDEDIAEAMRFIEKLATKRLVSVVKARVKAV